MAAHCRQEGRAALGSWREALIPNREVANTFTPFLNLIIAQTGRVRIVICHKAFIFIFSPVKLPIYKACFVQTGLEENATVCFYANIVSAFSVTVFGSHYFFKYIPLIQRQSHIRTLQTAVNLNRDEAQHYLSGAENQNTEVPKAPNFLDSTAVLFKTLWHHCHFP